MSTNSLRRDAARILREREIWENLWLRYWSLSEARAEAASDVENECRFQSAAEMALLDIEDERELSDLERKIFRMKFMINLRTQTGVTRKPTEIAKELLDLLPKVANVLRKKCGGDHRNISKRLDQAYRFIAHGDALKDDRQRRIETSIIIKLERIIAADSGLGEDQRKGIRDKIKEDDEKLFSQLRNDDPISYPKEIRMEVFETLNFFAAIEEEAACELIVANCPEIIPLIFEDKIKIDYENK